jgi:hypothetical protein
MNWIEFPLWIHLRTEDETFLSTKFILQLKEVQALWFSWTFLMVYYEPKLKIDGRNASSWAQTILNRKYMIKIFVRAVITTGLIYRHLINVVSCVTKFNENIIQYFSYNSKLSLNLSIDDIQRLQLKTVGIKHSSVSVVLTIKKSNGIYFNFLCIWQYQQKFWSLLPT